MTRRFGSGQRCTGCAWVPRCALALVLLTLPAGPATGTPAASDGTVPPASRIESPLFFAVRVAEVDRSVEWYRATFGLAERGARASGEGWEIANLQSDELWVEIVRDDRAQAAERPRGLFKVGFAVADVEAVAEHVERTTGERPRIVDDKRHGVRILQLRDPDGNVVQLSSPLAPTDPSDATGSGAAGGR